MSAPEVLDEDDFDAPEGYRSASAKTMLLIGVAITSFVFFVAQFIVPQLITFYLMPGLPGMGRGGLFQVEAPDVSKAAFWQDKIRVPVTRVTFGPGGPQTILKAATLTGEWVPDDEIAISFSPEFLLPDGDRLWCVSNGNVALIEGSNTSTSYPRLALTAPSNPYLHEGQLRIIDRLPSGDWKVLEFSEGEWAVIGTMATPAGVVDFSNFKVRGSRLPPLTTNIRDRVHVLPTSPPSILFDNAGHLFLADAIPMANEQEAVSALDALNPPWRDVAQGETLTPFLLEGRLAGVRASGPPTARNLNALWLDRDGSEPFGTYAAALIENYSVVTAADGRVYLLTDTFPPGGVTVTELTAAGFASGTPAGGKSVFSGRFGPFLSQYFRTAAATTAATWGMLLAYVLILHALVQSCRHPRYAFAHQDVRLASVLRRAVGRGIDTLLFIGPITAISFGLLLTTDFEAMLQNMGNDPVQIFKLVGLFVLGSLTYMILMVILFGTLEGVYGWSPGKLLAGTRVVRTTLEPIGIFRGMIRQLLLMIDGWPSYIIGGVMVAVSAKRQRLGDLATDSIVVDAASLLCEDRGGRLQ